MSVAAEKKFRLLIVDDEEALRVLFSMALESDSYRNDCASGGEEALQLLSKRRYDLVLLDLRMPGVTGLEVLRRMRERGDLTKVIIVSAFVPGAAVLRAATFGVTTFIGKPMTVEFLRDTVKQALGNEVNTDLELAKRYADQLEFRKAYRVLARTQEDLGQVGETWKDLFRVLAGKAGSGSLGKLEGPSERLVTFQF